MVVDLYHSGQSVKDLSSEYGVSEVTNLIDQQKRKFPVHSLCEVLGVPISTYYKSLTKAISNCEQENRQLTEGIIGIYQDSKQRYGAPKIHHLLVKEGKGC